MMASESRKLLHSSPTVDPEETNLGLTSSQKIVNEQSEVNIGPNLPPSSVEADPRGGGFCLPFSQEIEDAILHLKRPENNDEWSSTIRHLGVAEFLHHAAATGKVDVLRIVLCDPTCNVNARDEEGQTALSLACSGSADSVGKAETVQLLLQNSADVLISYSGDYTCLHMAAFWGHTKVVEVLLDGNNENASWKNCKELIHRTTSDGFTALHMAATGNHDQGVAIARAILQALRTAELSGQGLPLDPKEHFHIEFREWLEFLLQVRNLLHLVGGEISVEVISSNLLAYGKRGVGRILKKLLGEKVYEGLVQTYVDLVSYSNARDRIGRTALHYAAWENKADIVAFLMWDSREQQVLGCVANVNIVDIWGFTALHLASKKGHENVAGNLVRPTGLRLPEELRLKLMDLHADAWLLQHRSTDAPKVLIGKLEEWEENYEKVDLSPMGNHFLEENYVQPNVQANSTGQSELQLGTNENNRSAPLWGPKAENSVWLEDRGGVTALHYAVEEEYEGVVGFLIGHSQTDVFVCASDGLSPWTIAFSLSCNPRIQRLLRGSLPEEDAWGGFESLSMKRAIREQRLLLVKMHQQKLLKQAIWLATAAEKESNSQQTIRTLRALEEQIFRTFAESLMDDPTYQSQDDDKYSDRPVKWVPGHFKFYVNLLHVVAYYGFERQLQALLDFNSYKIRINDLERLTSKGQSPLHFAVDGGPEVVAVLLGEKTLNLSQPNQQGKSPTQVAHQDRWKPLWQSRRILTTHPTLIENYYRDRQVYVDAVNAILVGAALIASVTFAGFLQPPLGYVTYFTDFFPDPAPPSTPESFAAVRQYPSVAVFWVFNSLSFFSAIATVLVGAGAVLPSSSEESLEEEVSRVRSWLRATAGLLAMSILCILGAFTAAGSASLPNTLKYQSNIIVTATIGVMLCLVMFSSFCYRLSFRIRRSVREGSVHNILDWFLKILWKLGIVDEDTYLHF